MRTEPTAVWSRLRRPPDPGTGCARTEGAIRSRSHARPSARPVSRCCRSSRGLESRPWSRAFLIRRAIHTMITLIIVLVLLFVIFRLMPGDPTRFFIRPGQTEADRQDLLVSFGFSKRVPAPGNGHAASFASDVAGTYETRINVTDSSSRNAVFYYTHTRESRLGGSAPRLVVEPQGTAWEINP